MSIHNGTRYKSCQGLIIAVLAGCFLTVRTQGADSSFSYQGHLKDGTQAVSGTYDFRLILYNSELGGSQIGNIITNSAVPVSEGLFSTVLDFGPLAFAGDPRWLEISVRPSGVGGFTLLNPRQAISPTPYAIHATAADTAASATTVSGSVPANIISGTIPSGALADGSVTWPKLATGTVSQLTNPTGTTTNVVVLNGGQVGINMANPLYPLDVSGTTRASGGFYTLSSVQAGSIASSGSLSVGGNSFIDGNLRALGTVFAGSATYSTANKLEVNGNGRVSGNLALTGDLTVGGKGNVRSDGGTQLKVGFTSGNFALTLSAGNAFDVQFLLPSFPSGTSSTQVRVMLAQFIPDAGTGYGFQQMMLRVYALDIPNHLCTVRVSNVGSSTATIDGTLYLMTMGPAE